MKEVELEGAPNEPNTSGIIIIMITIKHNIPMYLHACIQGVMELRLVYLEILFILPYL